jgi:hypothetical protein
MSAPPEPPQDPPWPPPGEVAALEPDTIPNHPLRAEDVAALLPKEIG